MKLIDFLESINNEPLKVNKEIYQITEDGFRIVLFWHEPSLNLSWYPILQIDDVKQTVFWREGSENYEHWNDIIKEAVKWAREKGDSE